MKQVKNKKDDPAIVQWVKNPIEVAQVMGRCRFNPPPGSVG